MRNAMPVGALPVDALPVGALPGGALPGEALEWRARLRAFHVEGRSPKSGHRTAAGAMQFPWQWNGGTIFPKLGNCLRNGGLTFSCSLSDP